MAQVPDSAVQQALAELKQLRASIEPIRAEDIERIQAVFSETDPVALVRGIDALLDSYTEQADQTTGKLRAMEKDFGLNAGQASKFLQGDRLSDTAKEQLKSAFQELAADTQREAAQAAKQAMHKPRSSGRLRTGRLNV